METKSEKVTRSLNSLKKNWLLYILLIPAFIQVLIFCYVPLPGIIISFMDYDFLAGFKSPFVGLQHYIDIFNIPAFSQAIINTLKVSILNLLIVFPAPIIFALMLNELKNGAFKRTVQTVSYLPYFLSWIAVIGMATTIYSSYGIVNDIRVMFLGADTERLLFLTDQNLFIPNVIFLTMWKELGWGTVIYLSAISGIDSGLYEAALIDGANKWKQCIHITLPSIMPTIVILFVLQIGNLFNSNFDLIYGLQNPFIDFDVISTLIYKQGITQGNYDVATAFGFMQGLISLCLVLIGNYFSKRVNNMSII